MMRNLNISILLVATLGLLSCDESNYESIRHTKVTDIQKDEIIKIERINSESPTVSILIKGTGKIEGQATISLMMHGKAYRTEELSGEIDFVWSGDWYSDAAKIEYITKDVSSGDLMLGYRFNSI